MRIIHDWEFLECEQGVLPISVAMRAEDGKELYLIFKDAPLASIKDHPWLMEHVVPHLPVAIAPGTSRKLTWNTLHPDYGLVRPVADIRRTVSNWIEAAVAESGAAKAQLWGWYSSYDHVLLSRLFGRMIDLPGFVPMLTFDLKQEADRLGNPALEQLPPETEHFPLAEVRQMWAWFDQLRSFASTAGVTLPGNQLR
jgi:hypothetical protein